MNVPVFLLSGITKESGDIIMRSSDYVTWVNGVNRVVRERRNKGRERKGFGRELIDLKSEKDGNTRLGGAVLACLVGTPGFPTEVVKLEDGLYKGVYAWENSRRGAYSF